MICLAKAQRITSMIIELLYRITEEESLAEEIVKILQKECKHD